MSPPAHAVEERSQRRNAGADSSDGELVAGPDGEVDVIPRCVEEGEFEEFGDADDADDADSVSISDIVF